MAQFRATRLTPTLFSLLSPCLLTFRTFEHSAILGPSDSAVWFPPWSHTLAAKENACVALNARTIPNAVPNVVRSLLWGGMAKCTGETVTDCVVLVPKNRTRRGTRKRNVTRDGWSPSDAIALCVDHFAAEYFVCKIAAEACGLVHNNLVVVVGAGR